METMKELSAAGRSQIAASADTGNPIGDAEGGGEGDTPSLKARALDAETVPMSGTGEANIGVGGKEKGNTRSMAASAVVSSEKKTKRTDNSTGGDESGSTLEGPAVPPYKPQEAWQATSISPDERSTVAACTRSQGSPFGGR